MITWVSELFWFGQYAFSLINSKRKNNGEKIKKEVRKEKRKMKEWKTKINKN